MEPHGEGAKDENDADVGGEPGPEVMAEEREVDGDDEAHHRQHPERDADTPPHESWLPVAPSEMGTNSSPPPLRGEMAARSPSTVFRGGLAGSQHPVEQLLRAAVPSSPHGLPSSARRR